ncbi:hypothetical protein AXX12_06410 [Anaerosporomusa subterranea]|uniref:Uncharacterized protein n=1 Tax=Anaerosporomusa subterranea TaxID=1794912 RepID=A0A154BPY0_ANASB|nr:hypothetical protein [Anaerosporomusa subterranea]KYZ76073.1 hypothetical protein AXX12_06410 [Anaerosporomusa subterranea]
MERKIARKYRHVHHLGRLHGKYKRYAAAVAGAAIMAGVALPGIPAAKVLAAENPSAEPTITMNQTTQVDKDTKNPIKKVLTERTLQEDKNSPPGRGWHEHNNSWPSSDENQGWYENGRIFYRSDNDQYRTEYADYLSHPVNFVKSSSEIYGFDPSLDSFKLLTVSSDKALVEVTRHDTGRLFDVLLARDGDHDWRIVEVRAL